MRNFYPYLFGHLVHSVVLFKLSKFYSRLFGAGGGEGTTSSFASELPKER